MITTKFYIKTEVHGVPYYVKFYKTTAEMRGLKDHATIFNELSHAEFWKDAAKKQHRHLKFEIKTVS